MRKHIGLMIFVPLLASGICAHSDTTAKRVAAVEGVKHAAFKETGVASYYAAKYHGKSTASGETFDMHKLTAAHRTLPFGTRVKVTDTASKRAVIVRINDRGPFIPGRIIDVSLAAGQELQMTQTGLADVALEVIQ